MATKLKKMRLTSVDLVRAGANQEADICLFKSDTPPEATESPTEAETNIFKRFIDWMRKNPTEAENEPHSHIEKGKETPDIEYIYKSALAESLHSIMQDDTLTEIEKKEMTEESLRQYAEKIRELEDAEEDYDGGDDIDEKAIEEVDDFDKDDYPDYDDDTMEEEIIEEVMERRHEGPHERYDIDEIEEVEVAKFNPYHDAMGRFATANGAISMTVHTKSPAGQKAIANIKAKATGNPGGGAGGLNEKVKQIMNDAEPWEQATMISNLVNEMKIGDRVTTKNYKSGDVMEFEKLGDNGTIADFRNIKGTNHMASTEQVRSRVREGLTYADYTPSFKEGGGGSKPKAPSNEGKGSNDRKAGQYANGSKKDPIPKSSVSVNDTRYRGTHGQPKGYGAWMFKIGGETVTINGKYSDAKKKAIEQAAKNGEWSITVLT